MKKRELTIYLFLGLIMLGSWTVVKGQMDSARRIQQIRSLSVDGDLSEWRNLDAKILLPQKSDSQFNPINLQIVDTDAQLYIGVTLQHPMTISIGDKPLYLEFKSSEESQKKSNLLISVKNESGETSVTAQISLNDFILTSPDMLGVLGFEVQLKTDSDRSVLEVRIPKEMLDVLTEVNQVVLNIAYPQQMDSYDKIVGQAYTLDIEFDQESEIGLHPYLAEVNQTEDGIKIRLTDKQFGYIQVIRSIKDEDYDSAQNVLIEMSNNTYSDPEKIWIENALASVLVKQGKHQKALERIEHIKIGTLNSQVESWAKDKSIIIKSTIAQELTKERKYKDAISLFASIKKDSRNISERMHTSITKSLVKLHGMDDNMMEADRLRQEFLAESSMLVSKFPNTNFGADVVRTSVSYGYHLNKDPFLIISELQEIVERYKGSQSGITARYKLAQLWRSFGNYPQVRAELNAILSESGQQGRYSHYARSVLSDLPEGDILWERIKEVNSLIISQDYHRLAVIYDQTRESEVDTFLPKLVHLLHSKGVFEKMFESYLIYKGIN
ncbi:MAG: hypothetical protein J4F29_15905 [Candidatus Latescibacteria bacterium]|nr:hypothetical protein [Candidatus Latescibacterota bacterium]